MFVNFNILNQLGSPAINSNTFANRPAAGQTGRLFVSTDTYEIYRDNGTTWDLIGGPGSSTITGTGTATQVAYFTSSQAIGSSANLFWDNTSGFLGVATATPSARIEAVKTDGVGIYANFTTNAGSGSSTTALWAKNVTNSSGFAAVIEETTPNTTAGQYPLLIKHSLSSGTAGVGMGTGIHWQLPDDAGTFKTTQLTIETINAAAATYATRYRFNVQNNGSSTPVAYINATGLGIFTATPGAALDIHSTGIMAQLNSTSATANSLLAFQRSGSGLWRIGDNYGGGTNYFELFNTVLGINAMQVFAATNKTSWQATETYTTGLARGNYFDYNLSVAAGGSFSSPNAITALTATLDLTLAGSATIPSGARSGLDAYNSIAFTGAGTLTHNQGTQIRAYSNVTAGWAFNGSAVGTITHLAGLRALFPDNSGSAVNVTNNYALLLNDQTANTGTVTYTNRWGVYQEGASDLNYLNANTLIGTTTNSGEKLQVNGRVKASDLESTNGTVINRLSWSSTPAGVIGTISNHPLEFYTNASSKMLLTSSGNLGLGVTPEAWTSFGQVFRIRGSATQGGGALVSSGNANFRMFANTYYDGSYRYIGNGTASQYEQDGYHLWSTAASGTAGNPISFVTGMVLTASNELAVGGSSISNSSANRGNITIQGSGNSILNLRVGSSNIFYAFATTTSVEIAAQTAVPLTFQTNAVERGRFTAGGNFLIGTTTDSGEKLQTLGSAKFTFNSGTICQFIGTLNNVAATTITNADTGSSARADFSANSDSATINLFATSSTNTSAATGGRASTVGIFTASGNTSGGIAILARNASGVVTISAGGSTERIRVKSTGQMRFVPLAADPSGGEAGDVYYNSGTNKLRLYDGTNWVDLN